MPASRIVNHTIKEIGFRDKFNVNVLGIRRKKEYLLQDLGDLRIHSGDVLLIQGTWSDISRLSKEDEDWVVLGEPLDEAAKVTLDYKAPLAAAIMILMDRHDGIRLHPRSPRHGGHDSRHTDGTDRMFPQCGSRL